MKYFITICAAVVCLFFSSQATAVSFQNLDQVLRYYKKLDWGTIPEGPKLTVGMSDPRVVLVRKRLWATGDLDRQSVPDPNLFDPLLEAGVKQFQKRHGLNEDGVIGASTVDAMNIPADVRVKQIEASMHRNGEAEPITDPKYLLVNIPAYHLDYFENGMPVLGMKIVVGKPKWETPVFQTKVTGILLNPTWHVPESIVKKEFLPQLKKDPEYLEKEEIVVVDPKTKEELDPKKIDWKSKTLKLSDYHFQQNPGPKNPLGRLKLVMPNPDDIYLHDTAAKGFFNLQTRNLSHGCIRISKPMDLALLLLKGSKKWNRKTLQEAIDDEDELLIPLSQSVPVFVIYQTVWLDEAGLAHFRTDVYGKDEPLTDSKKAD